MGVLVTFTDTLSSMEDVLKFLLQAMFMVLSILMNGKKKQIFKDNLWKFVWHVSDRQFMSYSEICETYAES